MRIRTPRLIQSVVPVLLCSLTSCASSSTLQSTPADRLPWLRKLIAEIEAQPATNPPSSIWRYTYRGAPVYFRPERCCDMFSELFAEDGALICHPSGGFSGKGDGKCSDFMDKRSEEALVWRDGRTS
jgi:hypothetical protein